MQERPDGLPPTRRGIGTRRDGAPPPPATVPPFLAVCDVRKRYSGVQAVDGLSFQQSPGEILALLGPNGAGKTTTMRMLVGITRPDSGTIVFRGDGCIDGTLPRERLGYLPEERGLYADSPVDETLEFLAALRGVGRPLDRGWLAEWLARAGLAGHERTVVGTLSKGNQQKVQLIAALLHRPDFAVLDEPFAGLDPLNQEVTLDLIRVVRDRGTTVLLSAHQMELVERIADRVLLMHRGRILLVGTVEALRGAPGGGARALYDVYVEAVRGATAAEGGR